MCGIVGFTHKKWSPGPGRIHGATETLTHRGPDQQGVFESEIVSLGATRLSILDVSSGSQPIVAEDGDSVIVFNGEIYNHLELRAELEARGHRFRTQCDTETVLYAFREWDVACFSRLRGMFGVAIWTRSARRLVIARDRMGIKPLYIARLGQDIVFGSELKAILFHPEIDRQLSMAGLDCYLSLNYVPCPWTLVEGVEKLPPGHWLEWCDGVITSDCYWRLPQPQNRAWNFEEAKEELDALLEKSVREHLLSDVPLGVWLSGGIDSSAIVHYAAQAYGSRLKSFSISFKGRSFDETAYIQQVVKHYGTDHEQFDLNPDEDLEGAIEEFAYYSDEPSADAGALPVWFLSRLCRTKTKVALSGEGADELFAGYLTYKANGLAATARRVPRPLLKLALQGVGVLPVSDEKISFEYKLKRFLTGCLMSPAEAHVYWNGTFSRQEKDALLQAGAQGTLEAILGELGTICGKRDDLGRYLHFDQKYYLPDDILVKSDRMSMAHAVEVRPPFLDHRIVEFAATLPPEFKIRGSRQKFLLKEVMRERLPLAILQRKKIGFDIPAHEWLRGPLRPLLVETLHAGLSRHPGLFRPKAVETCLQDHLERRANLGYHLWGLLTLFLWMEKWQIQSMPEPSSTTSLVGAITGAST